MEVVVLTALLNICFHSQSQLDISDLCLVPTNRSQACVLKCTDAR